MRLDPSTQAHILLVDDTAANIVLLRKILRNAGWERLESTSDPTQVVPMVRDARPDLILLDLIMPGMDGFAVMAALDELVPPDEYLPILVLTADPSPEARRRALAAGAHDFLTKPFDPVEVELRIRNLLATRSLHLQVVEHARTLEQRVQERTGELEDARLEILERLALAAEYRDDATGKHTERVGQASELLARAIALPQDEVAVIRRAAPLHDIGKIGIPDSILLKPGRLTDDEIVIMRGHTEIGARILSGSKVPVLRVAEVIAMSHHERWDGGGYPAGLSGEAIPLPGRILAVVDVFDALTSERPYKRAWSPQEAIAELQAQSGKHFDPALVDAFVKLLDDTGGAVWPDRWKPRE